MRAFLESRPVVTAVAFTVVGVLPLYLTSAQSVRLQQELHFGKTEFGLMVACFYLVSAVAALRLGPWMDRRGPTRGFTLAALLACSSAAGIAVAGPWQAFGLLLGVAGLANACGQLASNLAVASSVRGGRQGVAFAAKQAAVPTAAMISGLAIPWVGATLSWRWVYVGAAVAAAALLRATPRYGHQPPGPRDRTQMTPALLWLMIGCGLAGGAGNALASFLTDAAVTTGFSQPAAARLLTVCSVVAIATRLSCGAIIDRRQRTGIIEATVLLSVATAGLLGLAATAPAKGAFVAGALITFAGAWGWPGVLQYLTLRTIDLPAATSTGAVLSGSYLGTVVLPPLVGLAAERWSYPVVYTGLAGLVVVALLLIHVSRWLARRGRAVAARP